MEDRDALTLENCEHDLEPIMTEYGTGWRCKICMGTMINLATIKQHIDKSLIKEIWQMANEGIRSAIPCPQCGFEMNEVAQGNDEIEIELEVCTHCQLIWFEEGQLELAEKVMPAVKRREEIPRVAAERMAIELVTAENEKIAALDEDYNSIRKNRFSVLGMFVGPIELIERDIDWDTEIRKPWVTWILVAVTSIISLMVLESGMSEVIFQRFGFIPSEGLRYFGATFITPFFLHGNLLHLIGNMYFLLVFGDNAEIRLGHFLYGLILIFSTVFGNLLHGILAPDGAVVCIGASGGIAGIMVFYCFMFPKNKLAIRIGHSIAPVSAVFFGCLWLFTQIFGAAAQLSGAGNVSYLAHLGGALVGVLTWAFLRNDKKPIAR